MAESNNPSELLIVEGKNDFHVVTQLLKKHQIKPPKIVPKEGFENLHNSISTEVKASGRKKLGIIADANGDFNNRRQSILDQLRKSGFDISKNTENSTNIFTDHKDLEIHVGIWLMPDNASSGELEDFILKMIPQQDPILPRAQHYIDTIPVEDRKFENKKITRAYVHAWLAARHEPHPMGLAIKVDDLTHDSPYAQSFVCWFHQLFNN